MKVAVVHNIPIHYQHLLFQAIRKKGLDLDVLFLASGSASRHEEIGLSQDLYRYRIQHKGDYESAPPLRKATWTWSSLNDIRPNVVLVSSYYATECWSSWLWALVHRVPIVMWFESNEFDYPRQWWKELPKRLFVKALAGAHVYGLSNKDYLVKLGLSAEDIVIKRAVIDVEKFETKPDQKTYRRDGVTRLLFVGRFIQIKNLIVLVRAFSRAARESAGNLRLILAGVGPQENDIRREIKRLAIEDLVEFRGYVPQKDLAAVYREADFFVLPSTREPWGLVSLEAMLCRLPVLISTQCGCTADVVNKDTGWKFSPWNEEELATLIRGLPSISVEQIQHMGDAAHDLAAGYSPENCARLVVQSVMHLKDRSCRLRSAFAGGYAS